MTVLPPDPYKILGVSKDAQILEIRAAYRKLVLKCHPDKIQDPALKEEKQVEFQQVQQAYELLGNEVEREKYDRKAEAYELVRERERAKTSAARATSSTPKQDPIYYHVKEASPRATTFANSSPYGRTPPRSWEDTSSKARQFEESARYARKTASYEKERPSKREEERRRRKEDEGWAREKEREREREREMKEARKAKERKEEKDRTTRDREDRDKEKRKEEKKKVHSEREKEREKQRKSDAAEKHRSRHIPIIEETSDSSDSSEDDVIYEPKPDRKKSSSGRKPEDVDPLSTSDRTRKYSGNMEEAIRYLTKSGSNAAPAFNRAHTFSEGSRKLSNMVPVPTPPPATTPFAPPPQVNEPEEISEDDDTARRSSARPSLRRMSHDNSRSSREKPPSHKKSGSSRDHQPPIIVEAGSPHQGRTAPSLPRARTESYARPIPVPGFGRSETWYGQTDRERDRHERSRSRPTQGVFAENDESDDDQEHRHRPSRRTQSPEPMRAQVRYAVDGTKSIPIRPKQYHEQPLRGSYKTKTAHIIPNSSAPRAQRKHTAYARDYYEDERPQYFSVPEVKYATQFDERDISYSDMPYRGSYRADIHAL